MEERNFVIAITILLLIIFLELLGIGYKSAERIFVDADDHEIIIETELPSPVSSYKEIKCYVERKNNATVYSKSTDSFLKSVDKIECSRKGEKLIIKVPAFYSEGRDNFYIVVKAVKEEGNTAVEDEKTIDVIKKEGFRYYIYSILNIIFG